MDQAVKHCTAGIGIWDWASNDQGSEPDVVMACCGDVPTLETLAAVHIVRNAMPDVKVRVINVVNLNALCLILFEGGLRTPYHSVRTAWKPAAVSWAFI